MKNEPRISSSDKKNENLEVSELSIEDALDVLYWSFYYSQGDGNIQIRIFHYIAGKHPNWRLPALGDNDEQKQKFYRFVNSSAHLHGSSLTTDERVATQISSQYSTAKGILRYPDVGIQGIDMREALIMFIRDEIDTDKAFNTHKIRPRDKPLQRGYARSSLSHFAAYVLGGELPPGPRVYREMFDDIKRLMQEPQIVDEIGHGRMKWVREFHAEHKER